MGRGGEGRGGRDGEEKEGARWWKREGEEVREVERVL